MSLPVPREHGAYAQLGAPMFAALLVGGLSRAGLAFVAATGLVFIAHESALVLMGARGPRAQREQGGSAWWWLIVLSVLALGGGAYGVAAMPAAGRAYVWIPVVLAACAGGFCFARAEHTAAGELVAAVTLASASVPVALSGGLPARAALGIGIVFAAGFAVMTLAVRAVTGQTRRPGDAGPRARAIAMALIVLAATVVLALRGTLAALEAASLAVFCVPSAVLAAWPPHPRNLKLIGWSMVGASAVAAVLLTIAARGV